MKKVISILVIALMVTSIFTAVLVSADPPVENGAEVNGEVITNGEVVNDGFEVEGGDGEAGIVGISAELDGYGEDGELEPPTCMDAMGQMLPMLLIMAAAFYFLMIRPNKKRQKEQQNLLAAIKVSDEVVSIGGIHGKVIRVKDDTFLLETGVGTQKSFVHIERSAISRITKEGAGKNVDTTPTFDEEGPEYQDSGDNA